MSTIGGSDGVGVGEEKGRRKKVELLQEAIHGLLEDNRVKQQHGEEEGSMVPRNQEEDLLLSSLLSKLNALEKDVDLDNAELPKDLNKIKRQNMITHILLGTVIVMTAVWQFNAVSFFLTARNTLTNPFKSVGDMINSTLKRRGKPMIEAPPLPQASIPDVTRTDLPAMLAIGDSDS